MDRRHAYAFAAIATSSAVAAIELSSVLFRKPWPDITPWWSYANSLLTVGILGIAAIALAMRNIGAPFLQAAWWIGYVAAGYLIIHALTLRVSGNPVALLEVPLGLLMILFVRRAITPADPQVLAKHPHLPWTAHA